MISYKRTDSSHTDFQKLVQQLDYDLTLRNGDEQAKFTEFNRVEKIKWVIIAYNGFGPVGCGGFKNTENSAEIKRMYVNEAYRGNHIGEQLLLELEKWANEVGFTTAILETGTKQIEAQNLYKKSGYQIIPNYGPYVNFEDSICMRKQL